MENMQPNMGKDTLTSNTGHSLLNVFSTIIANAEMLQEDIDLSERFGRRLARIIDASRRGEHIIREIRNTSKYTSSSAIVLQNEEQLDGLVLVVDDDEDMVEILRRYLRKIGLEVITETDSIKALERFSDSPDSFSLIISDFDMPHMTGIEFCQHISAIRSETPLIMITGFDWEYLEEHTSNTGISTILRKPLDREMVVTAVQKLLS